MSYDFVNAPRRALAKIEIQGSTVWGGISSYNRDLTFTEVASGETDSLDIKLHDCDNHWLNDWLIDKGTRLLARIELENWDKQNEYRTIDCGEFICDSIKVTGYPIEVVIRSISIPVNGTKNTKKWEKVSVSAIAQDICNNLGVGLEYYADNIVIKSQTQSQQTDIDFLFKVCQEYGFGMKVYKNKIIIFDRAKQDEAESVGSFEVGAISESFELSDNEEGFYTGVKMKYKNEGEDTEREYIYGEKEKMLTPSTTASSIQEAQIKSKAALYNANSTAIKLKMNCMGGTPIYPGSNYYFSGLGKYSGKYGVDKATHYLGENDFYTISVEAHAISLEKNDVAAD